MKSIKNKPRYRIVCGLEVDKIDYNYNGLNVYFEYRENKSSENGGAAVFLLHGWGADLNLYNKIADVIAQKYAVFALDFPGFGKSPEPPAENGEAWSVSDYAALMFEFIKFQGFKNVILVGHSFGGRVIIKLNNLIRQTHENAATFEIDKIIFIDSAGIKPQKPLKTKIKQRVFKISKKFLSAEKLEKLRKKTGSADYNAASPLMRRVLVKTVNEDLTPLIPLITAPTLLIWGENDTATPISDAKYFESAIKDSGLVVFERCGHFSFLENPVLFERVLCSFLKI